MFKSQLEPPSENFMETQIFVENIFDTVKKAREAKAAARSLAESKLSAFELSPSKRKKARKSAKGKRVKATPTKRKQRKPRAPKEPKRTPRKYTKRAKAKPQNDIDDEEAAFILSSISQRSFDSFYNRLNGSTSVVIPLEPAAAAAPPQPVSAPVDRATAYHHVLLDHNYWVPQAAPPEPQPPAPPAPPASVEVNNNNCDATNTNAVKKRWLRQATTESTSPATSPNDMLKAPLKKRKVVHDIASETEDIARKVDPVAPPPLTPGPAIKGEELASPLGEIKSEMLPYTADKLREIHEKIEMEFGRKGASVIQSPHTSVIQRVNCHGVNSVVSYGDVAIKSPEKSVRLHEIHDGVRLQEHEIKIEQPDYTQQAQQLPMNFHIHQNHLFNIKPEPLDTKPHQGQLRLSPFDNKIQRIVGESLLIKPDLLQKLPPKIQFVGEGFQRMQPPPSVITQPYRTPDPPVQIVFSDKSDLQPPAPPQQIVHESIFKIDNNVYKIIENVPHVGESVPLAEKKPKKAPAKARKASAKAQKSPKKPKKSPQKSPKKQKPPPRAGRAKASPVKIDKEFMRNFEDIEDVPLKIRQHLANALKLEEMLAKKRNSMDGVRSELQGVIEAVNASPLKFDGNYPGIAGSPRKKSVSFSENCEIVGKMTVETLKQDAKLESCSGNSTIGSGSEEIPGDLIKIIDKTDENSTKPSESHNNKAQLDPASQLESSVDSIKIPEQLENHTSPETLADTGKCLESSDNVIKSPEKSTNEPLTNSDTAKKSVEVKHPENHTNSVTEQHKSIERHTVIAKKAIDIHKSKPEVVAESMKNSEVVCINKNEHRETMMNIPEAQTIKNSEVSANSAENSINPVTQTQLPTKVPETSQKPVENHRHPLKHHENSTDTIGSATKNCLSPPVHHSSAMQASSRAKRDSDGEKKSRTYSLPSEDVKSDRKRRKVRTKSEGFKPTEDDSEHLDQSHSDSLDTSKTSAGKKTAESEPSEAPESPAPPQITQQVASILEKVILRATKSDQEVPSIEAAVSDGEEDTQYRESVEEFHRDTLERLMQANKRFCHNPFRGGFDSRRPLKASVSFEYQPQHAPAYNRWGSNGSYGSYGSFHYDKIHHREPITTTYSMYRAQKVSSQLDTRWSSHQPVWPSRVESAPVVQPQPQPVVVLAPEAISPQAEALKNATSEAFGGFLKEKLCSGAAMLPKTKTASSDPRLNPSLVVDVKKDEPATPKKKLSLDQYRKRKSLTSITPLSTPEESINSNSKSPSPTLPPAFDPSIAAAAATG